MLGIKHEDLLTETDTGLTIPDKIFQPAAYDRRIDARKLGRLC
jgi:hypothetical protein